MIYSQSSMYEVDAKPHSGVQGWSRGDLFPAVVCDVERYDDNGNLLGKYAKVLLDGKEYPCGVDRAEALAAELLASRQYAGVLAGNPAEEVRAQIMADEFAAADQGKLGFADRPAADLGDRPAQAADFSDSEWHSLYAALVNAE